MRNYTRRRGVNYKVRRSILEVVLNLGVVVENGERYVVCLKGFDQKRRSFRADYNHSFQIQRVGIYLEKK